MDSHDRSIDSFIVRKSMVAHWELIDILGTEQSSLRLQAVDE
jgi:hypothetical protein